ncbi:MAG: MFS transporter, partial [Jannaschia sp.]
ALLLAYTNDYLDRDDMASASARLLFVNGVGAIGGPLLTGWLMGAVGPRGFWLFVGLLMLALAAYATWRMTRRAALAAETVGSYVAMSPTVLTPVTMSNIVDEWEDQAAPEARQ